MKPKNFAKVKADRDVRAFRLTFFSKYKNDQDDDLDRISTSDLGESGSGHIQNVFDMPLQNIMKKNF